MLRCQREAVAETVLVHRPPGCETLAQGACTRGSECTFSHDQRVREREEQQKLQAAAAAAARQQTPSPSAENASESAGAETAAETVDSEQTSKCPRTDGASSVADVLQRAAAQAREPVVPAGESGSGEQKQAPVEEVGKCREEQLKNSGEVVGECKKGTGAEQATSPLEKTDQQDGDSQRAEQHSQQEQNAPHHEESSREQDQQACFQQPTPQTQPCSPEPEANKTLKSFSPQNEEATPQPSVLEANGKQAENAVATQNPGTIPTVADGILPGASV